MLISCWCGFVTLKYNGLVLDFVFCSASVTHVLMAVAFHVVLPLLL